jgi:hypothetical protein
MSWPEKRRTFLNIAKRQAEHRLGRAKPSKAKHRGGRGFVRWP